MDTLRRIEALVEDIEAFDAASGGQFRQAEDREAFDIAARIERKMAQQYKRECAEDGVSRETGGHNGKAFA